MSQKVSKFSNILAARGFLATRSSKASDDPSHVATWNWEVRIADAARKRRGSANEAQKIRMQTKEVLDEKRRLTWKGWNWRVGEKKTGFATQELKLILDELRLRDEIERLSKRHFGLRARVEIADGNAGDSWVLFEFVRAGDKTASMVELNTREPQPTRTMAPIGLGGFSFRFFDRGHRIGLMMTETFGFGVLPVGFAERLPRLLREALLGSRYESADGFEFISLNEIELDPTSICFATLEGQLSKGKDSEVAVTTDEEKLLRNSFGKGRWKITKERSSWKLEFQIDLRDQRQNLSQEFNQPLSLLEAREVSVLHGYIDRLIEEGRSDVAFEACMKERLEHPQSQFILRRIALLLLAGDGLAKSRDQEVRGWMYQAHASDRKDLLFASVVVQSDLAEVFDHLHSTNEKNDNQARLDHLSELGGEIHSRISDPDSLASFEVALPEFLGDLWWEEDLLRAVSCYQRIVDRRGDLPRIVWKLVQLTRRHGDLAGELNCLRRLLVVEQRSPDLARVHFRIAQLIYEISGAVDEAIGHALKGLENDPTFVDSALFAVEVLEKNGRNEQAVGILDGILRKSREALSIATQSAIELKIGDLWTQALHRPDLAEGRYQNVLRMLPESLEALTRLRDLYRSQQRYDALAKVYESCMEIFERDKNKIALRETFEAQIRILRDHLKDPHRLGLAYQRAGKSLLLKYQEIDEVLGLRNEAGRLEWAGIFEALREHISLLGPGEDRARYFSRLGMIARDKLSEHLQARKYFLSALEEGYLETTDLHYLQEQLMRNREFEILAQVLENYAGIAPPAAGRQALLDLLALPEAISDVRKDQVAVRAYMLDQTSELVVLQRLQNYRKMDYAEALLRVLDFLWVEDIGAFQKEVWAKRVIDLILDTKDEGRFTFLEEAFRKLLSVASDRREALQEAVLAFKGTPQVDVLRQFVILVIEENLLPPLDHAAVERLLEGVPKELARYFLIVATNAQEDARAVAMATLALEIFRDRIGYDDGVEQALAIICARGEGPTAELVKLRDMVAVSQKWELLVHALRQFAPKVENRLLKSQLYLELGNLLESKMDDPVKAKQAFEDALSFQPGNPAAYWALAQVAGKLSDVQNEKERYLSFLSVTSNFEEFDKIEQAIVKLERFEGFEVNLFLQICKFVPIAIDQSRSDILAFLTTKLFYAPGVATHSKVNQFLEIGKYLSDSLAFRNRALVFYKEAMRLDAEDDRIWLPLYFLLREFGSGEERLEHLRAIIPSLEQDRRPLKSFPVTIETLMRDKEELERSFDVSAMEYKRVAGEEVTPGRIAKTNPGMATVPPGVNRQSHLRSTSPGHTMADWDEDNHNWRDSLLRPSLTIAEARQLASRAFGNDLEKHLATQALAIITGDAETLQKVPWQVWKDPKQMNYSLNAKLRLPDGSTPAPLKSTLARLVIELGSIFASRFTKKITLEALCKHLNIKVAQVAKTRRLVDPFSRESIALGLDRLGPRLKKSGLRCYDLHGLQVNVFFDAEAKEFYFDKEFWRAKGGSRFLHTILQEYWSVKLKYFVPLALDPVREVFPLLLRVRSYLSEGSIGRLKFLASAEGREIAGQLSKMNQEMLADQFQKTGAIEQGALLDIWDAMRRHLFTIDLADTLDLVDIVSNLSEVDVTSAPPQRIVEALERAPELMSLLRFCAQIRLES